MAYALQTITSLPFGNIIGGPMKAAIEAQALAAKSTIDFIQVVGFKPPKTKEEEDVFFTEEEEEEKDADVGEVRNVVFTYKVKDAEGNVSDATLTVPILTIVPIPFIRIDEMNIDFMAKIMEQRTYSYKSASESRYARSTQWRARVGWWWASASVGVNTSYSCRHSSSSEANSRYQTEMTMNVSVRAVQDELPAGMSRVLNMLESIIKEDRKQIAASTSGETSSGEEEEK